MNAPRDLIWTVLINGVQVGRIEDSRYQWLIEQAHKDKRLYLAQAVEVVRYALRALCLFLKVTPLVLFWSLLTFALLRRDAFESLFPVGMTALLTSNVTPLVLMAVALACGMSAALSGGIRNVFNDRRDELLRRYLKVAIPGELVLVCWDARSALHPVSPTP